MSDKKISQNDAVNLIKAAAAKQKEAQVAQSQQQGTPFDFRNAFAHWNSVLWRYGV